MKRALIITYYWPPSGGAGVQRWLKFAKYMPDYGWTPVVFTPSNPESPVIDESLISDIPSDIEVIKRPISEPYRFYKAFTGRRNEPIKPGFITTKKSSGWKEKLSVWIRGNLFIPDPRVSWVKPSVRFLSGLLKEQNFDVIITSGPPHSMHLIGLNLKRRTGIKWVADFRDPWTGIDFYKDLMLTERSDRKQRRLEKEVLRNADKVITVGRGCALNLSAVSGRGTEIIHNGYDEPDFEDFKVTHQEKFRVTHTGALNRDRNPAAFLEAWKNLSERNNQFKERSEIRLAGMVDSSVNEKIEELGISNSVKSLGYLPHKDAVAEMAGASVLLLPVNRTTSSSMIVTGKVFEYLASGKPILCICDPQSELRDMIKANPDSLSVDFDDNRSIEDYLLSRFREFLEGNKVKKPVRDNTFSRKNLTGKLATLLNSL